ncbi:cytochrome c oxidase subunit 4 [Dietzia psychralcaliphila]|uniref:Cytochrome c oxidase polypeptide 4 n=1 Tax=Dietzia psychralcaliphila TaxID=139021 RepID=A0AAD0JSU1_9ACTN|nr:cytochrome c oxidase subunit 4 [Dietzia psychralcaliphila]AWH95136.1 cytochrome C oxidase subunit IV [Dietzia psychralcaliphila]PTM87364.1 cytochrome c oxidase subunit IV [Dietzia psychralcaliphila]
MNATVRIFDGLVVFLAFLAIAYTYLTGTSRTGIEWVGSTALVLSAGLCLLIGGYLRFVARRINTLPEDYEEAEISDGAGELGFFSPHSFWPFFIAFSILIVGFGAAFWNWWVLLGGAVALIITACALVFEYHWGQEKH